MVQPRESAGIPTGGRYAGARHDEADVTIGAPLQNYQVVGFERRSSSPAPGVPAQPGGACFHCGAAIANCVLIQERSTGAVETVGLDCAERTGLDTASIRKMLAERYAEDRAARRQAAADARAQQVADAEAEAAGLLGAHGTESRYLSGCRCAPCREAAPHGTGDRFAGGECVCGPCLDHALASGFTVRDDQKVLVDLATGDALDGRLVSTTYGLRWAVDRADGTTDWFPFGPKRRSTLANKGVVEASVPMLVREHRSHGWRRVAALSSPIVDAWGEPIVRPAGV